MVILESLNIPTTPGCYLFKDEKEQIIYVGKSKFLPKRVKSYFQKNHTDLKTKLLVGNIKSVDFIITESESEALVVEENLIKLYKPRFNIKGKDDKTIRIYLILTEDDFPKIELVRNTEEVNGKILAQFTSSFTANEIYDVIHQVFPFRSCSYDLSSENINSGKFKSCLEYQMGNCEAPCVGLVKKFQYTSYVSLLKQAFEFNFEPIRKDIIKRRNYFSKKMEFEKANVEQHRLISLETLVKKLEPLRLHKVHEDLKRMGEFLKLKESPIIIESFDNSHTSSTNGVAASVRFVMGSAEKSSYRRYLIKEAKVGDDYASFEEILTRRFTRLVSEKIQLPNLILMDGGKSQVEVAKRVMKNLNLDIDIIGVSKDSRHRAKLVHLVSGEEIDILKVPYKEILGKISEEVHRFAIKFHREKRDKLL